MGPGETTPIGTVPASVPASVNSSSNASGNEIDIGALLQQTQGDTAEYQKLLGESVVPVAGAHVGQIPSAMTRPIGPAPQTEGYARPRNEGEAISNMLTSAGNAVSKVITAERQQKQTHLTDAATRLFTAQAAIDEAQQMHDSATAIGDTPAAAEAQKLIEKNTAVRDGITSDRKLRDSLAKGLNINYLDPSKNKTEAHAAVQAAIKNAKNIQEKRQLAKQALQQYQQKANQQAVQNFGQAFAKSQPQTLEPNQLAQQKLAAYQQQRKDAIETLKVMGPVYAAQLREQGAITVESMRGTTELYKASVEAASRLKVQLEKNLQDDKNNASALRLEQMRGANARSLEALKEGNPIEVLKSFNDAQKDYETALTENQKSRQALFNELDKASHSRAIEIRRRLQVMDAEDEQAKNAFTLNRNVIAKGLGLNINDPRLAIPTVPTVQVGEGAGNDSTSRNDSTSGKSSSTVSPDLDPRTGKPWTGRVSEADKLIVKSHYEARALANEATHKAIQTTHSINKGVDKVKRFFNTDSD